MILCRLLLILVVMLMAACTFMLGEMSPAFRVVAILLCIIGAGRKMYTRLTTLGSARWAEVEDLRRAGMLDAKTGLILGRVAYGRRNVRQALKNLIDPRIDSETACRYFIGLFGRRKPVLVRLANTVHTSIFSPSGGGKGTSGVLPWLLTTPEAAFVLDVKGGELARITAEKRRKMGRKVYILDPYHCVTDMPATLNPVEFIDKHSPYALDDSRGIAAAIVDRSAEKGGENNTHFLDNAQSAIAAVIATVVEYAEENQKSLQSVCDITSSPEKWEKAVKLMIASPAWEGMLSRMGGNLTHLKDRELASTMSTIARFLCFLSTPAIAATTRASTFDPREILDGNTDVFCVLPAHRVETLKPLLRLWTGTFLRTVLQGNGKTRINFICDEAGSSLGKMDEIETALTVGRSAGIRLQLYYQDLGQLKKCWPGGADQTLLANTTQVFFGVADQQTAEYVSNRLGEETIIVTSGGRSGGESVQLSPTGQSTTRSRNWNENWQQNARRLLKPEEVTTLSPRLAITFAPGMPPILSALLRHYEERLRPPGWWSRWKRSRWSKSKLVGNCFSLLLAMMFITAGVVLVREEWSRRHPRSSQSIQAQPGIRYAVPSNGSPAFGPPGNAQPMQQQPGIPWAPPYSVPPYGMPGTAQPVQQQPGKPWAPPYAVPPYGVPGNMQPMQQQPGGALGFPPFGRPGNSQPKQQQPGTPYGLSPYGLPGGSQPKQEQPRRPYGLPGGSQPMKGW